MLEFEIAENVLDISEDTAVQITLANPAFDQGSLARAYSYPFRLPHSPANVAALQHRHRLDARDGTGYMPAALRIAGTPFQEGRAYVQQHSERSSEIVFQNESLGQIEALEKIKLRELQPAPITIPAVQQARIQLLALNVAPHRVEVNGEAYESALPVLNDAMNAIVAAINADFPGLASWISAISYLQFDWDEDLEGLQIDYAPLSYSLADERQLSEARAFNLQVYIDANPAPFRFPTAYNPSLYDGNNPAWSGYINWFLNDKYDPVSWHDSPAWENTYIPYVRLRWLLDQIAAAAALAGIVFDVSQSLSDELDELLLDNTFPLDLLVEEYVLTDSLGWQQRNGFATQILLENHLPDWSAKEFLTRLAGALNCHFRFEDDQLILKPNQAQALTPEQDWTPYTSPAYSFEPTATTGIEFSYDEAEELLPDDWSESDNFILGAGENPYQVPFRPLWNRLQPNALALVASTWRTAYSEQVGTSSTFNLRETPGPLRLFIYRGIQEDLQGNTYRLGASDREDASADELGDLSLIWAEGYFALFWRAWAEFMFTPIITRTCWLPLVELLRLRDFREPLVRIFHDDGEATALVRNVQVRISPKGLSAAKIEFQRRL